MSAVISGVALAAEPLETVARGTEANSLANDRLVPNALVRWAFYLSVFSIPFTRLYLPGSGDRIGVIRLVQVLILCGVLSQPRVCIRLIPTALLWFVAYCAVRILFGLWLTPQYSRLWWPSTLDWLEFSLPWLWVMFNVLQFPGTARRGLWALALGCSLCALLHVAGVGVVELNNGVDGRSTVFGENANVVGVTYAVAIIVIATLGMFKGGNMRQRLLVFALIILVGTALAKTGSRTSVLILAMGICVILFQGRSFGSPAKRLLNLLLVAAVIGAVIWQIPTVMKRFQMLESYVKEQEGRVRMMPVLWEIFLRSPIYGSGPADYQIELTRRAMPYLIKDQRTIVAHNLVLLLLVETGIIGLLLFACGVKAALVAAWRARLKPCGSLPLALILPLAIAGTSLSDPSHHMIFWFAMAYALAGTA